MFDVCDEHGLTSLMLAGKKKLSMIRPLSEGPNTSRVVPLHGIGEALREATESGPPRFIFVHSASPDLEGHAEGWMSPGYIAAIHRCDGMVGELVAWVRESGLWDSTLIIITADHGGSGTTHNGEHPEDIQIPWIVSGGLGAGAELPERVMIYDTAPTVLRMLGLPIPEGLDGRPIEGLRTHPDVGR